GRTVSVGSAAVPQIQPRHRTSGAHVANADEWRVPGFAPPAIAAAMLEFGSWRWTILVMVPICVVALVAGWRTLPKAVDPQPLDIDWVSAGLLIATVGFFLGAVSDISIASVALVGAGTIVGTLLWRQSGRAHV